MKYDKFIEEVERLGLAVTNIYANNVYIREIDGEEISVISKDTVGSFTIRVPYENISKEKFLELAHISAELAFTPIEKRVDKQWRLKLKNKEVSDLYLAAVDSVDSGRFTLVNGFNVEGSSYFENGHWLWTTFSDDELENINTSQYELIEVKYEK